MTSSCPFGAFQNICSRFRAQGRLSQLIPSPSGKYTALVVEHPADARVRSRVLKVIRTEEAPADPTEPLHQVTLDATRIPRLAWRSDDLLLVDTGATTPLRTIQGQVRLLFAPWQAELASRHPDLPAQERPHRVPPVESTYRIPGLSLTADFAVLAGGAHGGRSSTLTIDQSGSTATTMSVRVDHPGKPVVLMLAAYQPTIWSIQCAKGTTLLAVLASGYHRQVVTGLDEDTPVAIHTHDNKSPCGSFLVDEHRLGELNRMSLRFFEREVDKVYPAHEGVVFMGESPNPRSQWVGRGNLRRANILDKHQWDEEMEKLLARGGMNARLDRRSSRFRLHRAYVVLKPMTLPEGLCGSRSAVFFVPKGMERPRGHPGHSTIYDFNDMSCTGPFGDQ